MERLRGSAETTVDDKGRFKVPAVFRESIETTFGTDFFITSLTGEDVLVYPMPVWNLLEEKFARLPVFDPTREMVLDLYNTFGQAAKMDAQGRLLVPSLLRETAALSGDALVIGQTDFLKVVDRARHLKALRERFPSKEERERFARLLG